MSGELIYIVGLLLLGLISAIYFLTAQKEVSIRETDISLQEVLPIQNIENKFIINGNGDVTAGYKIFLPEAFTISLQQAKKTFDDWDGILKMLPAGTVIHQQGFYYSGRYQNDTIGEQSNYIHRENLKYYEGRPILHNYFHLYITFTANPAGKKDIAATSLLRKPNYPFKQPYKDIAKEFPQIESHVTNYENGMKGITGMSFLRMNDDELNNSIYDYINSSYDTPTTNAKECAVNPMSVSPQGELKIGNKFISVLSLVEEGEKLFPYVCIPKTPPASSFGNGITIPENIKSNASMVYCLGLGLPINHVLNVVIEITDTDQTVGRLKNESTGLNALAVCYGPARQKQQKIKEFCNTVSQQGYNTAYTSVNLVLFETDSFKLQRNISIAANAFMNMNHSKCYVENYDTANLFFSTIPGNARSNFRGFTNTTLQGLTYLCKESLYISDPSGYIFLDRFGCPCVVNLWDSPKLKNKNGIMIGPSGTGKSYWLNGFILMSLILGFDVMIIDIGGSYKSMITLNGGKYYDSRDIRKFAFNPFLCQRDKAGKYIYQSYDPEEPEATDDTVKFIASIIVVIWKGEKDVDNAEWVLLKKSIVEFYNFVNCKPGEILPSLLEYSDFLKTFEQDDFGKRKFDIPDLLLLLEAYTVGEFSFLLNGTENIDITNENLVGFDMEAAAKKEYFPIVSLIVLNATAEKIKKRRGIKKRLIIDEGLDFLLDKKMGEYIASLYRTYRKKEGGIWLAAQNVAFIDHIPQLIKESVVGNCDVKVILDHREYRESYSNLQRTLSLTENDLNLLDSIQTSETWRQFFIKIGGDAYVFGNEVGEIADAAFDSRQSVVVEIEELFKETRSLPVALNQYIENKHKKNKPQVNQIN